MKANYRKINDGSHSSSTYHKKDGTNVRAKLKADLQEEINSLEWAVAEKKEYAFRMSVKQGANGRGRDPIAKKFAKEAYKEVAEMEAKLEALKSSN